ncbi:MAG: hypothetical protein M1391_05015 [Bacteroidetes bacterium]|nr:hypothetical protein [Bacteroidota bacterium]
MDIVHCEKGYNKEEVRSWSACEAELRRVQNELETGSDVVRNKKIKSIMIMSMIMSRKK